MNAYEKHVSKSFQGLDADTSHSVKGVGLRLDPDGGLPFVAMVRTHKRPHRIEAWGFPGGTQEAYETYKEALAREFLGEAGIIISPDAFPEKWSRPFERIPSDKPGAKFHQPHWYFGFLTDNIKIVEITEVDEVIERGFPRLNEIPLPDYSGKNGVPSLLSHIQKLELVLMHVEHEVEDADIWLEVVQERFGPYLRRYNNR